MNWKQIGAFVMAVSLLANWAVAAPMVRITEWMYNGLASGSLGEFVEFTNFDTVAVDMTGWSFDDSTRAPGSQSLTAFGVVQPGQSVVLTDMTAANFRTAWNLPASVLVIGGNGNNLGRADEVNLYDNSSPTPVLVDRLTYDDQTLGGTRTNGVSANPPSLSEVGQNHAALWIASTVGDGYGSYQAVSPAGADVGNPGTFIPPISVPEPSSIVLMVTGAACLWQRGKR